MPFETLDETTRSQFREEANIRKILLSNLFKAIPAIAAAVILTVTGMWGGAVFVGIIFMILVIQDIIALNPEHRERRAIKERKRAYNMSEKKEEKLRRRYFPNN